VLQPKLVQTSFDEPTVSRFFAETGLQIPGGDVNRIIIEDHFAEWVKWKASMITSWVKCAKEMLRGVSPGLTMGLFGVPWLKREYAGAIRNVIGQDYAALAEHVDVFSPMAYHAMCGRPVSWIADSAAEIKADTGKRVMPVVQCTDMPRELGAEEFTEALRAALGGGTDGIMLFELNALLESEKKDIVKQVFASA
jgi:hypothetical protein